MPKSKKPASGADASKLNQVDAAYQSYAKRMIDTFTHDQYNRANGRDGAI
jgi:hypothetical protein